MFYKFKLSLVLALVVSTGTANASIIHENTDVGAKLNNHGNAGEVALWATTQIDGKMGSGADLWEFFFAGGDLAITTVDTTPWTRRNPLDDSQLFLFDSNGIGISANDDIDDFNWLSSLSLLNLSAGTYYLGISGYDVDPITKINRQNYEIFPDTPFEGQVSADYLNPLHHWSGEDLTDGNRYSITFATSVPEPSIIALMGAGLFGLGFARRRKQQA